MSRTTFSASRPRRGGTYRPQLDHLEDRLAPGSLLGTLQPPGIDPGVAVAQRDHEANQLAFLAGLQVGPAKGLNPAPAPDLPGPGTGGGGGGGGGGITRGGPHAPTVTTSPVLNFGDLSLAPGSSTLMRTDNGVTIHLHTSGLAPGAYTFWWVVFNPGSPPVAGRAAGHVVGQSGIVNVSAHLRVGETVGDPPLPLVGVGTLQDARHAAIWLVVRYHGPVDPGHVYEQTHTFQPELGVGPPADVRITMHPAP